MDGEWSSPSTWSGDQVPSPNEKVLITHHIHHNAGITVESKGSVTIENGGKLSLDGKVWNYGTLSNHDSLDFDGLEGNGSIINTGFMQCTGYFISREGGNFYESGHLQLDGKLIQRGYMEITGTIYITGNMEHWGESYSPPGKSGRIDICGDAKYYSGAIVNGNIYLCVHCGGIYLKHAGAIGDFNLDCGAFPNSYSELVL